MNICVNNINFLGNYRNCNMRQMRQPNVSLRTPADTFIRTTAPDKLDLKNIKLGKFINQGRDAVVYKTNNDNYVLRILRGAIFKPEKLLPVYDWNGLIVAASEDNKVQLQKYVKGEPLYGKNWNVLCCDLDKNEYMETFNKINNLPDESFAEYIRTIINIRKSGYDIDTINPNNILLDGNHLNIVDIVKRPIVKPELFVTDFDSLVNCIHIGRILSDMNKKEISKFADGIKILYDRIMNIAKKEGYVLDIGLIPFSPIHDLYFKDWEHLSRRV